MKEYKLPIVGGILGGSGVFASVYAAAVFGVHNLDIMMAALGPLAFRVAPAVPGLDAQLIQRIYIMLAIAAAGVAVVTLVQKAIKRIHE